MAKQSISYTPQVLDLTLYAGDGPSFSLTVKDPDKVAIPLTGTMIAQIRADFDAPDPPLAEFAIDLSESSDGVATFSLTGSQTQVLVPGDDKFVGVWDVQWTPAGGQPMTLCRGKVECYPDVSR